MHALEVLADKQYAAFSFFFLFFVCCSRSLFFECLKIFGFLYICMLVVSTSILSKTISHLYVLRHSHNTMVGLFQVSLNTIWTKGSLMNILS